MKDETSLVARTLKAKHYPRLDFLNARKGPRSSFTWQNIFVGQDLQKPMTCSKILNLSYKVHADIAIAIANGSHEQSRTTVSPIWTRPVGERHIWMEEVPRVRKTYFG
ncbi:conserved hypothetical protein [Ricinus communis]|uniref:Uncharacterized protein n=1 Tax=Ricinus communis TaxID=3988 RepID=B9SDX7_RICCO|nr:conserved hypothetical protein [Ricinus communis]